MSRWKKIGTILLHVLCSLVVGALASLLALALLNKIQVVGNEHLLKVVFGIGIVVTLFVLTNSWKIWHSLNFAWQSKSITTAEPHVNSDNVGLDLSSTPLVLTGQDNQLLLANQLYGDDNTLLLDDAATETVISINDLEAAYDAATKNIDHSKDSKGNVKLVESNQLTKLVPTEVYIASDPNGHGASRDITITLTNLTDLELLVWCRHIQTIPGTLWNKMITRRNNSIIVTGSLLEGTPSVQHQTELRLRQLVALDIDN